MWQSEAVNNHKLLIGAVLGAALHRAPHHVTSYALAGVFAMQKVALFMRHTVCKSCSHDHIPSGTAGAWGGIPAVLGLLVGHVLLCGVAAAFGTVVQGRACYPPLGSPY